MERKKVAGQADGYLATLFTSPNPGHGLVLREFHIRLVSQDVRLQDVEGQTTEHPFHVFAAHFQHMPVQMP